MAPPGKDWKEKSLEVGSQVAAKSKDLLGKAEKGVVKAGDFLQKKWDNSGMENKLKNLFK